MFFSCIDDEVLLSSIELHSTMIWSCTLQRNAYNFLRNEYVVQVDYTTFVKS
ncbi:hypothetical protein HanRHA438_Chr04g0195751 [Helianthus annuus]|nr:hypothetical protein HanRHA438_Chr04g0195751 [Helianthus annuus]